MKGYNEKSLKNLNVIKKGEKRRLEKYNPSESLRTQRFVACLTLKEKEIVNEAMKMAGKTKSDRFFTQSYQVN